MKCKNSLKRHLIIKLFASACVLTVFHAQNGASAKYKDTLEDEYSSSIVLYNQQQKEYKLSIKEYELKLERDKSFETSAKRREEYNSLLEMYGRQQKDFYRLEELSRQLNEKKAKPPAPFQLFFLCAGLICVVPSFVSFFAGTILFRFSKKPFGKILIKLAAILGAVSGVSLLISAKCYITAFLSLSAVLICVFFYKKKKENAENML